MFNSKNLRTILPIIVILVILSFYFILRLSGAKDGRAMKSLASHKTLRETNTNFTAGLDAVNQENLLLADAYFTKAYADEKDPRAKSIIALNDATAFLRLATSTANKVYGVSLAARLLDSDDIGQDMKAYAIQAVCQWYMAVEDPELYSVIFDDPHFAAYAAQDKQESINNLYKYSLQYYKLSIPLLKTARWDVAQILLATSTSPDAKVAFLGRLDRLLWSVDTDTKVVEMAGNSVDLMAIYHARARLLADLEIATGDQKFGEPTYYFNLAYERAMLANAGLTKGYILLSASRYYLAKGDNVLMNKSLDLFSGDESIARSKMRTVIAVLPKQKDASHVSMAKDLRKMAAQNASFKKSLVSMGFVF